MDGVLADFSAAAREVFGMEPEEFEKIHGQEEFWRLINEDPHFFINLQPMKDMRQLYESVKHLNPTILTGIPRNMDAYENQKHMWAEKHFGKEQRIICCRASKKHTFCTPGDILIDDRPRYRKKWEQAGGVWITHRSAEQSLDELRKLGVI
jgi:5'(3')-deoxyribonucleotidase